MSKDASVTHISISWIQVLLNFYIPIQKYFLNHAVIINLENQHDFKFLLNCAFQT